MIGGLLLILFAYGHMDIVYISILFPHHPLLVVFFQSTFPFVLDCHYLVLGSGYLFVLGSALRFLSRCFDLFHVVYLDRFVGYVFSDFLCRVR